MANGTDTVLVAGTGYNEVRAGAVHDERLLESWECVIEGCAPMWNGPGVAGMNAVGTDIAEDES